MILDNIVHSTTVDLFDAQSTALAPRPTLEAPPDHFFEVVGVISYTCGTSAGSLSLSLEPAVYGLLRDKPSSAHATRDLTRELTNQLMGRIKNRLSRYQVNLRLGLPCAVNGHAFEAKRHARPTETTYVFRSLRGHVLVNIDSALCEAIRAYASTSILYDEGALIEF